MFIASRLITAVAMSSVLSFVATGCDKKEAPPAETPTPAPAAPGALAAPALVAGYDNIRAALADDDLARTKTLATAYKATVAADAADAAGMTAGLDAIVAAADIEAARDAFGTLSEGYIKHLTAHPDLKTGLVAYRCPMARGYKKWVQREAKMANPYMGKAMLECGGATELAP